MHTNSWLALTEQWRFCVVIVDVSEQLDSLIQCFSARVLWNLRVLPVVSKGSAEPRVLSKKIYCIRLDAFCRLLVDPKCICGRGSTLNPAGRAYRGPPDLLAGEVELAAPPRNLSPLSAFGPEFQPFGPHEPPQKRHGFHEDQNCCKGFHFTEKVEKHCLSLLTNCLSVSFIGEYLWLTVTVTVTNMTDIIYIVPPTRRLMISGQAL